MTLTELIAEVYLITTRPDLDGMTKSAVKAATLKAHQSDYYSKDIFETGIQFDTAAFTQQLDYINLFSNFRSFKYLRRVEDQNDDMGTFFDIIAVDEVLDSYGRNRTDIAYVAGRVIEIRASVEFQFGLLGCYVNPIITDAGYLSWVAEQHPYFIIHEAARQVFKAIGQMEESNGQRELVAEQLLALRASGLSDVGY